MSARPDSWTRRHPRGGRTRRGYIVLGWFDLSLRASASPYAARLCTIAITPEIRARLERREEGEPAPLMGQLGIVGCARTGRVDGRGRWFLAGSDRQVAP